MKSLKMLIQILYFRLKGLEYLNGIKKQELSSFEQDLVSELIAGLRGSNEEIVPVEEPWKKGSLQKI